MSINPTFKCINFRGNVQTRLSKLKAKVVDATLLAIAGLNRMDMERHATKILTWDEMLPAVAQGAIGLQCRSNDDTSIRYTMSLNHDKTKSCVDCERAFLKALDGNCKTPIAGQAIIDNDGILQFKGLLAMPDGTEIHEIKASGLVADCVKIGQRAGEDLKKRAGDAFFQKMFEMSARCMN